MINGYQQCILPADDDRPKHMKNALQTLDLLPADPTDASQLRSALVTTMATECAICTEAFRGATTIVKVPCSHIFHPECLHKWAQEHMEGRKATGALDCAPTCPICRKALTFNRKRTRCDS